MSADDLRRAADVAGAAGAWADPDAVNELRRRHALDVAARWAARAADLAEQQEQHANDPEATDGEAIDRFTRRVNACAAVSSVHWQMAKELRLEAERLEDDADLATVFPTVTTDDQACEHMGAEHGIGDASHATADDHDRDHACLQEQLVHTHAPGSPPPRPVLPVPAGDYDGLGCGEPGCRADVRSCRCLAGESPDEPCPDCGADPGDDALHRDACPRIGTTGQFGPPWQPRPWGMLPDPKSGWRQAHPRPGDLLERSSLGTPEAKALREQTPPEVVERIMARVAELEADEPTVPPLAEWEIDLLRKDGA